MLKLLTNELELRGIESKVSKKGTPYYVLRCEDIDTAEPQQFVCKDFNMIPQGLKKGDLVQLQVGYNFFKELDVLSVVKAV